LETAPQSTPSRTQFLLYRLFSLAGLIPIGAYVVVHLITNSLVLNGPAAYQDAVGQIHALGIFLPIVEWVFIFIPILFHAAVGFVIILSGMPNSNAYPYGGNIRYTLQRATGMIVFAFIVWHVIQMHRMGILFGGAHFNAEAATSSTATTLAPGWVRVLYAIGIVSAVYHLSNGLWTQGITWGIWTTQPAMRRAGRVCFVFGLIVGFIGLSALYGFMTVDVNKAKTVEHNIQVLHEIHEGQLSAGSISGAISSSGQVMRH
jgi:succinate dehydrogenase / fumarate reductase, cytochrome b subunit